MIVEVLIALALTGVATAFVIGQPEPAPPPSSQPEVMKRRIDAITGPRVRYVPKGLTVREPVDWLPSQGDECHEWNGNEICEGPRKVPRPRGEAAQFARRLGLGTRAAAGDLLSGRGRMEWTLAVAGRYRNELRWPVPGGRLWRGLDEDDPDGSPHKGVDIGAPVGTPILAISDGLVAYSDNELPGYGNVVLVIHADGSVALYAHCRATWVFAGQQVRMGQQIAEVGLTGISRGAHLHFELRRHGEPVDPMPMLNRWLRRHPGGDERR